MSARPISSLSRRQFLLRTLGRIAAGTAVIPTLKASPSKEPPFRISLAQWSVRQMHNDGIVPAVEFPVYTRQKFGIDAVEYVNTFFPKDGTLGDFVNELRQRCEDQGVKSLLIMCDGEGHLGDPDKGARLQAVRNHEKWLDAAAELGCHSIRVNAHSEGTYSEQLELAADGLQRLSALAQASDLNVIVENHGGLSSNAEWLEAVIRKVALPNCGVLPDFGNFQEHDRYSSVQRLMPYARGVSAKSHDFDEDGNETGTDYFRMIPIVLRSGYRGHIGIEYEGSVLSPDEGILATKRLLIRTRDAWTAGA
ncbi:MAG: sugar phosphate isomerase/epimerase family protein [Opitutaceae bacterium]